MKYNDEFLDKEFPSRKPITEAIMALFTAKELIQAANEATKIEKDRIVELVLFERLFEDAGTDEDAAYNRALDDVLTAIKGED